MSDRPIIAIAGQDYVVTKFFGDLPVHGTPTRYVDHVLAAGGRPVIVPTACSTDLLDAVDGIVLAGGGDLDPRLYGAADDRCLGVDRSRDDAEIALVLRAQRAGVPLLGVCRGAQVLAVAFGGVLEPHLGDHRPHVIIDGGHRLTVQPASLVERLLGPRPVVNSLHHQAVRDAGPSWRVTARAADGVVEAIEWADGRWPALGVQWHPELEQAADQPLFSWLVRTARRPSHTAVAVGTAG